MFVISVLSGATLVGVQTLTQQTVAQAPPAAPVDVKLPVGCKVVAGSARALSATASQWLLDCGANANQSARAFLGRALGDQGWTYCGGRLAVASWWKAGITTTVTESDDPSMSFKVLQQTDLPKCP